MRKSRPRHLNVTGPIVHTDRAYRDAEPSPVFCTNPTPEILKGVPPRYSSADAFAFTKLRPEAALQAPKRKVNPAKLNAMREG